MRVRLLRPRSDWRLWQHCSSSATITLRAQRWRLSAGRSRPREPPLRLSIPTISQCKAARRGPHAPATGKKYGSWRATRLVAVVGPARRPHRPSRNTRPRHGSGNSVRRARFPRVAPWTPQLLGATARSVTARTPSRQSAVTAGRAQSTTPGGVLPSKAADAATKAPAASPGMMLSLGTVVKQ